MLSDSAVPRRVLHNFTARDASTGICGQAFAYTEALNRHIQYIRFNFACVYTNLFLFVVEYCGCLNGGWCQEGGHCDCAQFQGLGDRCQISKHTHTEVAHTHSLYTFFIMLAFM